MYKKIKMLVCFLLILILTGCNAQRNDLSEQVITTEDVNELVETKGQVERKRNASKIS